MAGCFGSHPEDVAREHELDAYLSQYDDEDYTELEMLDAQEKAVECVLGDSGIIQDVLDGEYERNKSIAEKIAALLVCQDKYHSENIEALKQLFSKILNKEIEQRAEIELELLHD